MSQNTVNYFQVTCTRQATAFKNIYQLAIIIRYGRLCNNSMAILWSFSTQEGDTV